MNDFENFLIDSLKEYKKTKRKGENSRKDLKKQKIKTAVTGVNQSPPASPNSAANLAQSVQYNVRAEFSSSAKTIHGFNELRGFQIVNVTSLAGQVQNSTSSIHISSESIDLSKKSQERRNNELRELELDSRLGMSSEHSLEMSLGKFSRKRKRRSKPRLSLISNIPILSGRKESKKPRSSSFHKKRIFKNHHCSFNIRREKLAQKPSSFPR